MRRRMIAVAAAGILAAGLAPLTPASADHNTAYCNPYDGRSTIVEIGAAGNNVFYVHDRSNTPGTGLLGVDDHGGGTWMFMENNVKAGLQTGGEAIVFVLNDQGSDDPCPNQGAASDPVIF